MTTETLKPCPFCGNAPTVTQTTSDGYLVRNISCYKCKARPSVVGVSKYEDQLKFNSDDEWNRRSPLIEVRVKELEERNKKLREALEYILEYVEPPPPKACSCHISPPCWDCVDHGGLREALELSKAALKGGE